MMQFNFKIFMAFFILFMFCGVSLIMFQVKWEGYFKNLQDLIKEFAHDVSVVMQTGKDEVASDSEKYQKNTVEIIRYHWAMPILLTACFPIDYMIASKIFFPEVKGDVSPIVLLAVILIPLTLLVIGVFAHSEKNIRHKFWMELVIVLFLEIFIARMVQGLLSGYYFQSTVKMKWLYSNITVFVPLFLYYCIKTQENWQAMLEQNVE